MRVSDVMKTQPRLCSPEHGLGTAGRIMVEVGCGVLPVVAESGVVVGMITDRDICCTVSIRDRRPSEIRVSEAMSEVIHSCRPDDDIEVALETMRSKQVRRLPVVDEEGALVGLLALDDVALEAKPGAGVPDRESLHWQIAETVRALATHPSLAGPYTT